MVTENHSAVLKREKTYVLVELEDLIELEKARKRLCARLGYTGNPDLIEISSSMWQVTNKRRSTLKTDGRNIAVAELL